MSKRHPLYQPPYVECDQHGKQIGFAVCEHVVSGQPNVTIQMPTENCIGAITCGIRHSADNAIVYCIVHAIEYGFLPEGFNATLL